MMTTYIWCFLEFLVFHCNYIAKHSLYIEYWTTWTVTAVTTGTGRDGPARDSPGGDGPGGDGPGGDGPGGDCPAGDGPGDDGPGGDGSPLQLHDLFCNALMLCSLLSGIGLYYMVHCRRIVT